MTAWLAAAMFPVLMCFIFLGFPVAFSLMGTAFIFGLLRWSPDGAAINTKSPRRLATAQAIMATGQPDLSIEFH